MSDVGISGGPLGIRTLDRRLRPRRAGCLEGEVQLYGSAKITKMNLKEVTFNPGDAVSYAPCKEPTPPCACRAGSVWHRQLRCSKNRRLPQPWRPRLR